MTFTDSMDGTVVFFQVLKLRGQVYAYASAGAAKMGELTVAAPPVAVRETHTSTKHPQTLGFSFNPKGPKP